MAQPKSADPKLIESEHSCEFEKDSHTVQVHITRMEYEKEWVLEVVDKHGTSTVWDDKFRTERMAWKEFLRTIEKEGIESVSGPVEKRQLHEIWKEQCEAAQDIKLRYGLQAAFDNVVTEKLLNFISAAADHPEFARELPRFVSEVRRMFTSEELRTHMARIEREQKAKSTSEDDKDETFSESSATVAARARQFAIIKELLTAQELGTS